jgi:hypothetical protein
MATNGVAWFVPSSKLRVVEREYDHSLPSSANYKEKGVEVVSTATWALVSGWLIKQEISFSSKMKESPQTWQPNVSSLGDMITAHCGKTVDEEKRRCLNRNQSKCQFVYHPFILSLICKLKLVVFAKNSRISPSNMTVIWFWLTCGFVYNQKVTSKVSNFLSCRKVWIIHTNIMNARG